MLLETYASFPEMAEHCFLRLGILGSDFSHHFTSFGLGENVRHDTNIIGLWSIYEQNILPL